MELEIKIHFKYLKPNLFLKNNKGCLTFQLINKNSSKLNIHHLAVEGSFLYSGPCGIGRELPYDSIVGIYICQSCKQVFLADNL